MKFQDSQVELRLRTPDEAIDVGVLLTRKYWWQLLSAWAVFAIPLFGIACFIPNTFFALLFFWWFKPLYERLPLQIVSSAIFLQTHSFKSALSGTFQNDTLSWLTIFRFCPGRSTLTPIGALEGLDSGTGKIRRRRQLIKSPIISTYLLLHVGMFACEAMMVVLGVVIYMTVFEPVYVESLNPFELLGKQWNWLWISQEAKVLMLCLTLTSTAFIAPFYICAGFALYINRRIGLEGWDLYLGFQRLVSRFTVMCVALLIFLPSINLVAQDATQHTSTTPNTQTQVRSEVDEIMQEHIVHEETSRVPREIRAGGPNLMNSLMQVLSLGIIALLIGLLLGLVVWVVIKLRVWEFVKRRYKQPEVEETKVSVMSDAQEDVDLPSNVVAEAKLAWQQGRAREALSLLYRGAILYLIAKHSCPIEICDTERTCARVISRRVPSLSAVFNKLSLHWQQVAYGKKTLADQEFRQLVVLYEDSFA